MVDDSIPYAYHHEVVTIDDVPVHVAWVVQCPVCGAFIEEKEKKDFESHTGSEYAEHYEQQHRMDIR